MSRILAAAALSAAIFAPGAQAAVLQYEDLTLFNRSSFSDLDVACNTRNGPSCVQSATRAKSKTIGPFDTSLGILQSVTVDIGMSADGVYLLRGEGLLVPEGRFVNRLRVTRNGQTLKQTIDEKEFLDQTIGSANTVYNFGLDLDYSQTFTSANDLLLIQNNQVNFSLQLFQQAEVKHDVFCDGTSIVTADNPCGATNRTQSFSTPYDFGPTAGEYDFWYLKTTYTYVKSDLPPPDPYPSVPLPASGLGLMLGGAALAALRRRRR